MIEAKLSKIHRDEHCKNPYFRKIFLLEMNIRKSLRQVGALRMLYNYMTLLLSTHFRFRLFRFLSGNYWYWKDYWNYQLQKKNERFKLSVADIMPFTEDKTSTTPIDPVYFFQDCWLAKKIVENKPAHHYDVASNAKSIGLISQFVPVTMIDIRPIELKLDRLHFIKGSLLELPFPDNSIESISSICVVEHIGLGRYGDPLDSFGSEKAIRELLRVSKPGGNIYITVPVDSENKICFNAHRTFTPDYIKALFANCELKEERYIYGTEMTENYFPEKGFGTGLYGFRKME